MGSEGAGFGIHWREFWTGDKTQKIHQVRMLVAFRIFGWVFGESLPLQKSNLLASERKNDFLLFPTPSPRPPTTAPPVSTYHVATGAPRRILQTRRWPNRLSARPSRQNSPARYHPFKARLRCRGASARNKKGNQKKT